MTTIRVLSYGGGTQSAALALMSAAGVVDRLDAVIFADTQGELPATYAYAEYVAGHLAAADIPFITVTAGNLERAVLGLERSAEGGAGVTLPAFVRNTDGSDGKVSRYTCSYDYKRRQVTRATKRFVGGRGAWKDPDLNVEQWIGFSTDEVGRAKPEKECRCGHVRVTHADGGCGNARCSCEAFSAWRVNRWPLLELGYRRADTIRWFTENGHPTPPRSACWFCPNQGDGRWRTLKAEHPDLFERAVALDVAHRTVERQTRMFDGIKYLHRARVPLDEVDLRSPTEVSGQDSLFDDYALALDCEAEVCFT